MKETLTQIRTSTARNINTKRMCQESGNMVGNYGCAAANLISQA